MACLLLEFLIWSFGEGFGAYIAACIGMAF